jgi:dihydrofolate reductase
MKLVVTEFVTMDGVMEAPGGEPTHAHTDWVGEFMDSAWLQYKLDEVLEAEAHLLGRVTYESFAGAWPQREGPMADKINSMPKFVVSTTLEQLEWNNSTLIADNVVERIRELRAREGGTLLVAGSHTLVHTLIANNLIDELRLMTFPVTIGSGLRVFPETPDKTIYRLTGATAVGPAAVTTYEPALGPY